jgi:hypothetical protein
MGQNCSNGSQAVPSTGKQRIRGVIFPLVATALYEICAYHSKGGDRWHNQEREQEGER